MTLGVVDPEKHGASKRSKEDALIGYEAGFKGWKRVGLRVEDWRSACWRVQTAVLIGSLLQNL